MKFEPPTDEQKRQWAKADVLFRADIGGVLYEVGEHLKPVYALTRDTAAPSKANAVGYNTLIGVIEEPTETLVNAIRIESRW